MIEEYGELDATALGALVRDGEVSPLDWSTRPSGVLSR